jgi:glucose-1-phosphate adenylyltransferase
MIANAFGMIYTDESNVRLKDLTYSRSIAAVPFGGRYRCIDFMISSLVNSGIGNVGIITQRNYHSLMDHLGSGKEWDLSRKRDGLFILPPFVTKENTGIYKGTVDALKSIMGYIRRSAQRYCIFVGSHTIFNMQFNAALEQHIETGADVTMIYNQDEAPFDVNDQFDDIRLQLDARGRVTDMEFDPFRPSANNAAMGIYIIEKSLLEYLVEDAYSHGSNDFVRDVLFKKRDSLKLYGYRYDGYVARLTSISAYYRNSLELLKPAVRADLFCADHPIYTKVRDEVPAHYGDDCHVVNAMVANGLRQEGDVENCILFRGVRVARGASVKNSIIMQDSEIQENAQLEQVVLDKQVLVRRERRLIGHESFPIILRKGALV